CPLVSYTLPRPPPPPPFPYTTLFRSIPPHSPARRGPLLDAFGRAATRRLGLLVPQREQLRGPGRELRGAVAPELRRGGRRAVLRSEEHTSALQSRFDLVCRLLLEKKK